MLVPLRVMDGAGQLFSKTIVWKIYSNNTHFNIYISILFTTGSQQQLAPDSRWLHTLTIASLILPAVLGTSLLQTPHPLTNHVCHHPSSSLWGLSWLDLGGMVEVCCGNLHPSSSLWGLSWLDLGGMVEVCCGNLHPSSSLWGLSWLDLGGI